MKRAESYEVVKVPRKPSADDEALDRALGDGLVARLSRRQCWDSCTREPDVNLSSIEVAHLLAREESRIQPCSGSY